LDTIAKLKQQNVYSVVGVHPKKLGQFNPGARRALRDLWRSGELVGFGEFGLDRTTPTTDHIPQEDVVRELLEFLPSEGVIVLHVRGRDDDRLAEEPLHRLLWLLQEGRISRSRRIHLHCWSGSRELVNTWLRDFPNTFFSVNYGVSQFSEAQREGLLSIPRDRLLLESDSPYFPPLGYQHGAPHLLGRTLQVLARVLGLRTWEVADLTGKNAENLYFPNQ
jgi:TatD DNase family protein